MDLERRPDAAELAPSGHSSAQPRRARKRSAPLVSVVIPCYNHARFLGEAIQSVLDQAYPAIEIIVVNDGSTDDTNHVIARFPVARYVVQDNRGLAAARNAGLAECRGEFVVFLDADDRLLPGAIEIGTGILQHNPALGFAAGHSRFISGDGAAQPTTNRPVHAGDDPYAELLRRNSIRNPATVMFRRDVVEALGRFGTGIDACADYELYLRISRHYPVVFHETVVADYRNHGENMSDNSARMLREGLAVLRRQRGSATTPSRREALKEGMRNIRRYYGDRLTMDIRTRLRSRAGWSRTLRDVAVMIWYHPVGALEQAGKKIAVLLKMRDAEDPGGGDGGHEGRRTQGTEEAEDGGGGGDGAHGTRSTRRHGDAESNLYKITPIA